MVKRKALKAHELPNSRRKLTVKQHLLPPLMGLLISTLVLGVLYSPFIAVEAQKYAYYRESDDKKTDQAQSTTNLDPKATPSVKIGKIEVDAPLIFGQKEANEAQFQKDLQKGVVHYPGTAEPGKLGNVSIFGHSSGQVWAPGDYKFVFSLLGHLEKGDKITIDYKGTRYIYEVTTKSVVLPSDVSVLYPDPEISHKLTIITCTPVGTNEKRLIIGAKQISPTVVPSPKDLMTDGAANELPALQNLPGNDPGLAKSFRALFN